MKTKIIVCHLGGFEYTNCKERLGNVLKGKANVSGACESGAVPPLDHASSVLQGGGDQRCGGK